MVTRRKFVLGAAAVAGAVLPGSGSLVAQTPAVQGQDLFRISLAQWSLHRAYFGQNGAPPTLDPLAFARTARRDFDIGAVEYISEFYRDKVRDQRYLKEMKTIADGEGVFSHLIMCAGEGEIGDYHSEIRTRVIENYHKWVDMAAYLGCASIRVYAESSGSYQEQQKLVADGLTRLADYASQYDLSIIVENHGGWSSHAGWLAGVMQMVDNPAIGTLPDFGNFGIAERLGYDPYEGVRELMPFAHGVSAKSHHFTDDGSAHGLDYHQMMTIVLEAGFRGYVGIEFEGQGISEHEGVRKTKALLERVRGDLADKFS